MSVSSSTSTGSRRDDDALEVRRSVRGMKIDRFIVEAVLDSYLLQMTKKDVVAGNQLMTMLETDEEFTSRAHKAVLDGLVYSTFVGTLDDAAFLAALDDIESLEDDVLELMRQDIFDFGVQVACQSVGGAPSHGKTQHRCGLFKSLVSSFTVH